MKCSLQGMHPMDTDLPLFPAVAVPRPSHALLLIQEISFLEVFPRLLPSFSTPHSHHSKALLQVVAANLRTSSQTYQLNHLALCNAPMLLALLSGLTNHIFCYCKVPFSTNIVSVVMLLMRIELHQTALPSPVKHPVQADDILL